MASIPLISPSDAGEIRQDVEELFRDLAASVPESERARSGECHPAIDVMETERAVEIFVDAAGIPARALRVAFRGDILLIAGEKAPARATSPRTFHLVEREFGRFARAVRLHGAFDVAAARASLEDGELHIFLPRLAERRGRLHQIEILEAGGAR